MSVLDSCSHISYFSLAIFPASIAFFIAKLANNFTWSQVADPEQPLTHDEAARNEMRSVITRKRRH